MRQKLNEKVSVVSFYSARRGVFVPYTMRWKSQDYSLEMDGLVHKYRNGDTWHHIFEIINKDHDLAFRLNFNTKDLNWTLEVVSDGLPS